jgi:hypothetical protein
MLLLPLLQLGVRGQWAKDNRSSSVASRTLNEDDWDAALGHSNALVAQQLQLRMLQNRIEGSAIPLPAGNIR